MGQKAQSIHRARVGEGLTMSKLFDFLMGVKVIEVRNKADFDAVLEIVRILRPPYTESFLNRSHAGVLNILQRNTPGGSNEYSYCVECSPSKGITFGWKSEYEQFVIKEYFDEIINASDVAREIEELRLRAVPNIWVVTRDVVDDDTAHNESYVFSNYAKARDKFACLIDYSCDPDVCWAGDYVNPDDDVCADKDVVFFREPTLWEIYKAGFFDSYHVRITLEKQDVH